MRNLVRGGGGGGGAGGVNKGVVTKPSLTNARGVVVGWHCGRPSKGWQMQGKMQTDETEWVMQM